MFLNAQKIMNSKKIFPGIFLILLFACLYPTDALAIRPRSRAAEGIIENIDTRHRTLTIKRLDSDEQEVLTYEWKDYTKFFREDQIVNAEALRAGARINYWYRSPLFGKPFVTRVMWKSSEAK